MFNFKIPKKINVQKFLILYAIILFFINFHRIFDNSFWADECYSINLLRMGFGQMIQETAADVHPPLYYIILRLVCFVLGQKGWVFHLVSVIPVGLTLLFSVTKVYQQFGLCTSFLLATFSFFLDNSILFSVEVRMYSWANFFVLMSFYQMYEIITKHKKEGWLWFSFYSLAAAYTHYYALLAVAFLYAMLILYEIWKKGENWKKTMKLCMVAVVMYLPWLIHLLQAFGRTLKQWWLEEIPQFRYCIQYLFSSKAGILYVGIWTIGIVVLCYRTYVYKKESFNFTFFILSGLVCILGTISVGEIISLLWRPMFQMKYVYVTAGVAWLIFGLVIEKMKKKYLWTMGIMIFTLIMGIPNYYNWAENDRKYKMETEQILECTKIMGNTDVLLTNSEHLSWTILEYYYPGRKCILWEKDDTQPESEQADWVFWNREIEELKDCKIVEGYLGPYNYIYVYKIE